MKLHNININGLDFKWGMTFEEVVRIFDFEDISTGNSFKNRLEIKCNEIFGIKTIACEFIAPFVNRPVMQCGFDLVPKQKKIFENVQTPYVKQLINVFGSPQKISKIGLPKGLKYNEKYANGSVIYSCEWKIDDIRVSLSIFGGIRTRKEGEFAAGLYFHWENEIEAAKPFLKNFINQENDFINKYIELERISLKNIQLPFFIRNYNLIDPEIALKNMEIRTSQLILYSNLLFRTPNNLSQTLDEYEIIILQSEKSGNICICNKWDFSVIRDNGKNELLEIRPLKGLGGYELKINSLNIVDDNGEKLTALTEKIENLTGFKIRREWRYDD